MLDRPCPLSPARFVAVLPLAIVVVGCAGQAPAPRAADQIGAADRFEVQRGDDALLSTRVTATAVAGGRVSFGRYAEEGGIALRGRAYGRGVNVTVARGRAVGLLGTKPVDLTVSREGSALHYTGLVGGNPSSFWVSRREIRGTIGACGYELNWSGAAYVGTSGCGNAQRMTSVVVPTLFARWSTAEVGAALGILLSVPSANRRIDVPDRSPYPEMPPPVWIREPAGYLSPPRGKVHRRG
jgi:hypothetical protein